MEELKVPKFLLKILSSIVTEKAMKKTDCQMKVDVKCLDVIKVESFTTIKIDGTFSVLNKDVPKLLEELGIM